MPAYNHLTIVGNFTRDPDLKYTSNGKAVCNFDIAVNHSWKDANGDKKEEVCFIPVTVWGKQAEVVAEFMKKGRLCLVEGRMIQERWETKDKEKRSRLKLSANHVVFLGSGEKKPDAKKAPEENQPEDENIPF